MTILRRIPFSLDAEQLRIEAHVQEDSAEAAELQELVVRAQQIGCPKALVREVLVTKVEREQVQLGEVTFTSRVLAHKLARVGRVFALLVTCGEEMEHAQIDTMDLLQRYWWDQLKEQMLNSATHVVHDRVQKRYQLGQTAFLLPGSGERKIWPIEQQRDLFTLFSEAPVAIGVTLNEACLMTPNKTLSGILFATDQAYRGCEVCRRESCSSRCAPFNPTLWQALGLCSE